MDEKEVSFDVEQARELMRRFNNIMQEVDKMLESTPTGSCIIAGKEYLGNGKWRD